MNDDRGELAAADGEGAADAVDLLQFTVDVAHQGRRVDAFLAEMAPSISRARIRRAIDAGNVAVDGDAQKPSCRLREGQRIELRIAPAAAGPEPESPPRPLELLYDDDWLAVVNKPAGMVVHPAKGHWSGTLASALVHRFGQLSGVGGPTRPGIVHRLDRDTSGAIVVAKTDEAHQHLADQFQARTVDKQYTAIVSGRLDRDRDRVVFPIGPHPSHREKMALRADHPQSRAAETFYEVCERFPGFALVTALPKTGRTHQIRLHMAHAGCPVLCDKLYGGRARITAGELRQITLNKHLAGDLPDDALILDRQALHARRLAFDHPRDGRRVECEAPLPDDLSRLLDLLRTASGV